MHVCFLLKRTSGHLNSKVFLWVFLMTRATKKEQATTNSSSETQGQLLGAGKSQNGRKKIRAKKSQEGEEEPLGTRF